MLLTLLGLVVTQVFWVKKSYEVAENDFDNNVNFALNDIIDYLKSKDVIFLLDNNKTQSRYISINTSASDSVSITNEANWISHTVDVDTTIDSNEDEVSIKIVQKEIKNGNEIIVTVDTIIDHSLVNIQNGLESQITNQEVEGDISNFIQEIIVQYTSEENPLQSRLNNVNLDSLISDKLAIHGVESNFNFGVTEENQIDFLEDFSTLEILDEEKSKYITKLFQDDAFSNSNLLVVQFEGKFQYIFNEMKVMLAILFLLTLLLLITFWMTLKIIWKQKKIDNMKNDFINNMTHEFKTPVATIGLALDALTHDKNIRNELQIRKFGAIIRDENSRINKQLERVLEITKFSDISMKINLESVNIKTSIQKSIDILSLQIENSRTILTFNSCDTLIVNANITLLETVWINLIDNAIKYSENSAKISIKCHSDTNHISIEFTDQGIGMTKETQARIFENFYRETGGNIHTIKGFGLGMSYVKKIIDLHQGEIFVNSKIGEGSSIKITLPKPKN